MSDDFILPEIVRLMDNYRGQGIRRILATLRRRRVLRRHNGVYLQDVPPADRAVFLSQAGRAAKELLRDRELSNRDTVWPYLRNRLSHYRKNARRRGIPFDLTPRDLHKMYARAAGACEVTGVAFDLDKFGSTRAPFAPSIDRINSQRGYEPENVRLTCQMVNLAMNVWGEAGLRELLKRLSAGTKATADADLSTGISTQGSETALTDASEPALVLVGREGFEPSTN